MRLVRSDEVPEGGAAIEIDVLRALAERWYGDRLDPAWRPRTREQSQAILDGAGLSGPFWALS